MTKINVISGFLGAGKTTLIKKLIAECFKGEQVVLVENEFGEIGIDGGFLKDAGIQITEMSQGCICCSLVGDFRESLAKVIADYHPDRIIIEPSGVGKLSDVIKAIVNIANEQDVELDSSLTVADANKCKMYMKNFGEFFNNQIENADTIVLSRTQNVDDAKIEEVVSLLRTKNEKAAIITTPWDSLEGNVILKAMDQKNALLEELLEAAKASAHDDDEECDDPNCSCHHHHHDEEECECHHDHDHEHPHHHDDEKCDDPNCSCHHDHDHEHEHHHHHHHADEVFDSWGKETPHKYSKADLEEILKTLANTEDYGIILRSKGIVPTVDGGFVQFDLVPGEYEIRDGQPDYTGKLCVIGSKLKKDELAHLFQLQ